jgi:hypothetical protein
MSIFNRHVCSLQNRRPAKTRDAAKLHGPTPSIPNYSSFDIFYLKFVHPSLKKCEKYDHFCFDLLY